MGHLTKIKSSYTKHFVYAMWFNLLAVCIVITGVIHSVFPNLFVFTPYRLAKKIVDETEKNFKVEQSER
jgi:hypothetical protein